MVILTLFCFIKRHFWSWCLRGRSTVLLTYELAVVCAGHICNWQCLWLHLGLIYQSCHFLKVLEIVAKLECLLRCPFTLPYGYCTSINTDDKRNVIWDEWMDAKMFKVLLSQVKGQMCSSGRRKFWFLILGSHKWCILSFQISRKENHQLPITWHIYPYSEVSPNQSSSVYDW